ncbi:MAG: inositol monophosphatase [Actinomycetota bacterium]|nr:inositol monophosphatase [Actinomycetota bacterium]
MTKPGPESAELYARLLAVAERAAHEAVELIHTRRPASFGIDAKSTATDLVTEMDTASEALIRSIIAEERPDDVVIGEEGGSEQVPADAPGAVTWYVDPIDGTTNYVYDHPGYNVSIAATIDDVAVAAVVADPTHSRTYRATRGGGAWCDDRQLHMSETAPVLPEALVATGFAYDATRRGRQGALVAQLLPQIRDIRRMGAAALDLCSVASGRVDAYYEVGLARWDLAAGALVAEEAGARLGSLDGGPVRPASVLVAHPALFEQLQQLLAELGSDTL